MFKKNEKIEIVDFEKEAKRRERKEKFQNKVDSAMNWIHNNSSDHPACKRWIR